MDVTLDLPIDPATNKCLTATWEAMYGFPLHPTQEGTHQILGSMWRALKNRQLKAEAVKGLYTLESTSGIEPTKKQWKVGDLKLIDDSEVKNREVSYRHNSNPFLFLCCLEVMMRTLAKAGSYYVEDPEAPPLDPERTTVPKATMLQQVLNIDRSLVEDHLAQCRAFVLEWSTKSKPPDQGTITRQMARIDLKIRERWCKLYRENRPEGKTFSKCIRDAQPMADQMWTADLTREMEWQAAKGTRKGGESTRTRIPPTRAPNRDSRLRDTRSLKGGGKGKSEKGGARGGKGESAIKLGQPLKIKGKNAKAAKSRGPKIFCGFFARGSCRDGRNCRDYHECPVILKSGRVCEKNHNPAQHGTDFQAA
jgi:hypothetical protein